MQFLQRRLSPFPVLHDRDFDDVMRRFFTLAPAATETWLPPARVEESDGNVLVTVELPGIEAKDVNISVDGRELLITGERKEPVKEKGVTCHLDQLPRGSFSLRLELPADVVADKTAADYKLGLVHVTLPKAQSSRRAKIPIQIGK